MGRRPAGTGPKRPSSAVDTTTDGARVGLGGGLGLVAYGSDDEHEDDDLPQSKRQKVSLPEEKDPVSSEPPPLPDGWEEVVDETTQVSYYWCAATQESRWDRPVTEPVQVEATSDGRLEGQEGDGEVINDEEKARRAAMEVEDLFKSLEDEISGAEVKTEADGGSSSPIAQEEIVHPPEKHEDGPPAPPPLRVANLEPLTEGELKKLSGKDEQLRSEMATLIADLQSALSAEVTKEKEQLQIEAYKLEGRLEDWRGGLLPSSSLVKRMRELRTLLTSCTPPPITIVKEEVVAVAAPQGDVVANGNDATGADKEETAVLDKTKPAAASSSAEPQAPPSLAAASSSSGAEEPNAATAVVEAAPVTKWQAVWDETHQAYYYFNAADGVTTWEMPPELAAQYQQQQQLAQTQQQPAQDAQPPQSEAAPEPVAPLEPFALTKKNTVLVYAGAEAQLRSVQDVLNLFVRCGPRQVRTLGEGYYCTTFGTSAAAVRAVRVAHTGEDPEPIKTARGSWVKGRRECFIRFLIDKDDPPKLEKVPLTGQDDGSSESEVAAHRIVVGGRTVITAAAASWAPPST